MAKKSFKENPALSFISQALSEQQQQAVPAPISEGSVAEEKAGSTRAKGGSTDTQSATDEYTHTHKDTDTHDDVTTAVYDDVSAHTDTQADAATPTPAATATHTAVHADTAAEAAAVFEARQAPYSEGTSPHTAPAPSEMGAGAARAAHTARFVGAPRESKSKRLQLLLRPSTYDGIARLAQDYQTSVNDIINQILEETIQRT